MKINSKDFRVREGDEVNLRKWSGPRLSRISKGGLGGPL